MSFLDKLTPGELLAAISYLIAVIIFIYGMKPRLDNHDKQFSALTVWQLSHENLARERDKALEHLAISMATLAETTSGLTQRLGRMENFLLDLSLEKRKSDML